MMKGIALVLFYGLMSFVTALFLTCVYEVAGSRGDVIFVYSVLFTLTFIALSQIPNLNEAAEK